MSKTSASSPVSHAGTAIAGHVVDGDHVLRLAPHAVFGPEERRQGDARRLVQQVDQVNEAGVDAGGVDDRADPLSLQRSEPLRDLHVDPEPHHLPFFLAPSSNSNTGSLFCLLYSASWSPK